MKTFSFGPRADLGPSYEWVKDDVRRRPSQIETEELAAIRRAFVTTEKILFEMLMANDGPLYARIPDMLAPLSTEEQFWAYYLPEPEATNLRRLLWKYSPEARAIREKAGKGQP